MPEISQSEFHLSIVAVTAAAARAGSSLLRFQENFTKVGRTCCGTCVPSRNIRNEVLVGRLVLIDAVGAVMLLAAWFFYFARYNRRKGAVALHWVEAACSNKGQMLDAHWQGMTLLQARFGFTAHWFDNARITIRLRPRPIPFNWFVSIWHKQKETLTFEADLGCAPGFRLDVFRHRWLSQQHSRVTSQPRDWSISRPGPVVLTTRTRWTQELSPVVNTLMTARGHNLISVRFRSESPHIAATVPLDALSDEQAAAGFLNVLRELAAGAAASRR